MGEDYSSREWFESLSWQHGWIEKMAGWWIGEFGKPRSVVDYGAGDGWWCKAFHDVGSTVWAVELHELAREFIPSQVQFVQHDLTCPLEIVRRLDLVICLEVAEHIPERYADILCQTLAASTGQHLLFSAAGPGQPGTGHVNLKSQEWWRERLSRQGIEFSPLKTGKTRQAFENIVNECFEFLPRNVQVYARVKG